MMFNLAVLTLSFCTFSAAFQPQFARPRRTSSVLLARGVDSSKAVQAALEASQKFGPTSKEARLAWESVEEMDSSDQSPAWEGGVSVEELETKMNALSGLLEQETSKIQDIKALTEEVQAVKLSVGSGSRGEVGGVDSSAMLTALKEAKTATQEFGPTSNEARLAWETVEEIASSDNSIATIPDLTEECLVEALKACEALEELSRAIKATNQ